MSTHQQLLNQGIEHYQSGRLEQAEHALCQVLQADPNQVDALHLLGLIAYQRGRNDVAIDYMSQALCARPDFVHVHNNLGIALHAHGKLDEALTSCRRALQLNPSYADAHHNLGVVWHAKRELDQALASFRQALRLKPDYAEAHNSLGAALYDQGKLGEALASFRQALCLKPDYAEAHNNLGLVWRAQGALDEAAASVRRALSFKPNDAGAHTSLGLVLHAQGELDQAAASHRRAVQLRPDYADAHNNLGSALHAKGELDQAAASYGRALQLKPDYAEAHNNLGVVLREQRKLDESITHFRESLRLKPDFAEAKWNLATPQLLLGDFEQGWHAYEWRLKIKMYALPPLAQPFWDGSDLTGRTILLRAEQGLGDTLQFIRYAPVVKQRGGTVLLVCPPALVRLLAGCPGIDRLVPAGSPLPPFDVHAPLLSLPRIFETSLKTVPAGIPYLAADHKLAEHWRKELETYRGVRVGIVWQGNPTHKRDRDRSMPLAHVAALAQLPGLQLFSLQKGLGTEQLRMLPADVSIIDLERHLVDFTDTAAIIKNLDLVITVDTAVAHLAGALGVPVWIAVSYVPDWRWLLDREDSPWYPTARLFRQTARGDWHGVLRRIVDEMKRMLVGRSPTRVLDGPEAGGSEHSVRPPSSTGKAPVMISVPQTLDRAWKHYRAGQLQEAEQLYRQVLEADPNHVDAWHLLGVITGQTGRNDQAIDYLQAALRFKPDFAEAHNNLGNVFMNLKRMSEAVASYRQAVRVKADYVVAHNNLGNALREQGQRAEAEASMRQALRLRPDFAEAQCNLGTVLREQGQLDDAAACFHEALRLKPNYAEAHNNLGIVYSQALHAKPDFAEARNNLGAILYGQGKRDEALACFRKAVDVKPDYAEAHHNLGMALRDSGQLDEAVMRLRDALRLKPDFPDAHFSLAMVQLLLGNFEQGWHEYEWRLKNKGYELPSLTQPLWNGSDLAGQTILLHAEQGYGDTLQFVRYAPLIKQRGGRVLLMCPPPLLRLLASCAGIDQLVPAGGPMPAFDVYSPLLSLPRIFATSLKSVPARIPYLAADARLIEHWREELQTHSGLRIGIFWQGNPKHLNDRHRSIPLTRFAVLAQMPGVQLFSLQKGLGSELLRTLAPGAVIDMERHLNDFMDTAAIIKNLDLVVTIDTAVAHVAGALGVPVWIALPFVPDWRWLLGREDSPWYPTARLFRQTERGDWHGVFRRIAGEIEMLLRK